MKCLVVMSRNTTTGRLLCKALLNIGCNVTIIYEVDRDISKEDFDMTLVWTNNIPNPALLPGIKVLHFLDDIDYWRLNINGFSLENISSGYDYVTTNNKWKDYNYDKFIWLPFGFLPELHYKITSNEDEYNSDVCFIGTNRGDRAKLISDLINGLKEKNFKIWGNNWEKKGIQTKAIYFTDYVKAISNSKIFITEHFFNLPSTKDFEVPAIGGALMLSDKQQIKEIYPMMPVYNSAQEAINLTLYYLEHEEERVRLVKEIQQIALNNYSYEIQLKKLLKLISN